MYYINTFHNVTRRSKNEFNHIKINHFWAELKKDIKNKVNYKSTTKSSNLNKEMRKGQKYPVYGRENLQAIDDMSKEIPHYSISLEIRKLENVKCQ